MLIKNIFINPYFLLQLYLCLLFLSNKLKQKKYQIILLLLAIFHVDAVILLTSGKNALFTSPLIYITYSNISFISVLLVSFLLKHIKENRTAFFKRKLEKENNEYEAILSQNNEIKEKIIHLENAAKEIGAIYESIKDMNVSLNLDDSFTVFSQAFLNLIHFDYAEVIILNNSKEKPQIKKIYTINENHSEKNHSHSLENHLLILKEISQRRSTFFSSSANIKDDISENLTELKSIVNFIAIPLLAETEIVAVLAVKNLNKNDLSKIFLLTTQFALEIKKSSLYEKVQELSWFDGLTGLYLNRYFSELVDDELKRAEMNNEPLSFLMIDVDSFKKYNDQYGHLVGDIILKNVATILKTSSREFDILARYGGDEFIVVLPAAEKKQAFYIAQRMKNEIAQKVIDFDDLKAKIKISISIGISSFPEDGENKEMLIAKADSALYRSKKIGKNKVTLFNKELSQEINQLEEINEEPQK